MGQSTEFKGLRVKDHFFTGDEFTLVKDPGSGIIHTMPIPGDLSKYYESTDYLSHNDQQKGLFSSLYSLAKRFNLKSKTELISSVCKKDSNHLDIGAGIGDLVKSVRAIGLSSEGCEPNQTARSLAATKGVDLKESSREFDDQAFSVITMYHVLEHVANLEEQVKELKRLLIDNGILILALPNIESYDAQYYGTYWAGYDVPRHLHHFSKEAIENLLNKDYELIETRPMWFDSFYVSILSSGYQKRFLHFLHGILIGFISNFKALFTKEPSSRVYIFKKRI